MFFYYLLKVTCPGTLLYNFTMDKSLFIWYQKNTAMFNWSSCTFGLIYVQLDISMILFVDLKDLVIIIIIIKKNVINLRPRLNEP